MYCSSCGIRAEANERYCSNCGTDLSGRVHTVTHHKTSSVEYVCIGSAIAGVLGLLLPLFGITPVVAIFMGIGGISNARENGTSGRGLAILGIILGGLALLLLIVRLSSPNIR